MRLYDPAKHELLLMYWYMELRKDPVEFENLFCEPLRSLTAILSWAKHSVNIMFSSDVVGIRFAAWCAPYLSGAEFGAWARKNVRGSKGHLKFMDEAYDKALSQYPVLIGLTKQEKLHRLHLRMGYKFVGVVPTLFDGSPVREYYMTVTTREAAKNERRNGRHNEGRHVIDSVDERDIRADRHGGLAPHSGKSVVRKRSPRKSVRMSKTSDEEGPTRTHAPDDSSNRPTG